MKTRKYEKIKYVCEICNAEYNRSFEAERCEREHDCECKEFYFEFEDADDKYDDDFYDDDEIDARFTMIKRCISCDKYDSIDISDLDLLAIWETLTSNVLMENVNGNKNQN